MVNVIHVLLALLSAYFIIDMACSFLFKEPLPTVVRFLRKTYRRKRKERSTVIACVAGGLIAGGGVYYLAENGYF